MTDRSYPSPRAMSLADCRGHRSELPPDASSEIAKSGLRGERLLRPDDIAHRLHIAKRSFERLLSAGAFPRPDLRIGRVTLCKPVTLSRWIEDESARQRGRGGKG